MEWAFLRRKHRPPRPIEPIYLNRAPEPISGLIVAVTSLIPAPGLSKGAQVHPVQGRLGGTPTVDQGSDQIPHGAVNSRLITTPLASLCVTTQASPEARL
jgi:hypothetical protein